MSVNDYKLKPDPLKTNHVKYLDQEDRVRLTRLIIEGLELALHICNSYVSTFGPMRLIDLLEQILPTAYVLNTSYWPIYQTQEGESPCLCHMFDRTCIHRYNEFSWLKLYQYINEPVTFKNGTEKITLKDVNVVIHKYTEKQLYIDSDSCARYRIRKTYEIQLEFKSKIFFPDGRNEYSDCFKFRLWFKVIKARTNYNEFCLWLTPHPVFTSIYGKHFSCLLENLVSAGYPKCLIVSSYNCPKHTILITHKLLSKYFETLTLKDVGLEDDRRQRA